MILAWLHEAKSAGAREDRACEQIGLSVRTVQRWHADAIGDDKRRGPISPPVNALKF